MPRRIAMSVLVDRSQKLADKVNDGHIDTAEWKARVSLKYGELFALVCETGLRYFEAIQSITATGADTYDEPIDHLSTIGVDYVAADGSRREVIELMIGERNFLAGQTGDARFFELVDDKIRLLPRPSSGTYEWLYVPQPPDLSTYADGDLVDVVNEAGEAMLLWGVAAGAKDKSESDLRYAMRESERAAERLMQWAANRALTQARRPVARSREELSDMLSYGVLSRGVPYL